MLVFDTASLNIGFLIHLIYYLLSPSIVLLPIIFWPFALISLVFDTASLNIGFLIYLIYYLLSPSIVLLPIVFWPFALISLVFDTASLNIGFLIYFIYYLSSPSIILLPIIFQPFVLISLVFDTASLNIGFLIFLIYYLSSPSIILLPIIFWPFALISLVFDTVSLNIGFLIYLVYYLSSPSIVLLPIVFWPFVLILLVFDTASLNIGFLIYLINYLLCPSIILLPNVFWPFTCCLYLIQWASTYFWSIWSIVYCLCHHPSTHHPFVLLHCLYSIQQSPYPGLLLSLPCFGTLFVCCQFMLWLLLSFVLHLNRTIPNLPGLFNSTWSLLVCYFKAHSTKIKRCSIWIALRFCNSLMFPFAFQFLGLHHKFICIFDTMRLSTLHCLYWIWWVSLPSTTTLSVIYLTPHAYLDMDTMSLHSSVHLLSCKYPFPHLSPSTTFLMPIFSPDFLPLPAGARFCQSHPTSPSSLQWLPILPHK